MSANARSHSRLGAVAIGLLLAMMGAAAAGSSAAISLNGGGVATQTGTPYPYPAGAPYGIHDWRRGNAAQLNPTICALGGCGGSTVPHYTSHPW
jgi:hypothetical protein